MNKFEKDEDKRLMLEAMKEHGWATEINENSSYDDVKEEFDVMLNEIDATEQDMYPNGRDYDAENPDD